MIFMLLVLGLDNGSSRLIICFVNGFALHDRPTRRETAWSATLLTSSKNSASSLNCRSRLILHASILQHVGPLSTCPSMAMLQVLAKVIGSIEFFGLVALVEFVHISQVLNPTFPILLRKIGKLFSAKSAGIVGRAVGVM